MSKASLYQTQLRRTYTNARPDEDDSFLISSIDSTTEIENSTHTSEEKFKEKHKENIVKDTYKTETGKNIKKSNADQPNQNTPGSSADSAPEFDKKIIEFFEKLHTHSDQNKSKKDLVEEFIRSTATEAYMLDMTKISNKEAVRLKGNKAAKWLSIFASGGISQNTSFLLASEIAMATNQAWLFPVLSTLMSEGVSDKAAALTRRTTFTTNDAKNLYRKQRLFARAVGDMIRQFGGLEPVAKYRSKDPAHKHEKFTAWDALCNDTDRFLAVSAHNLINRGAPFLCFTGTYLARDALLQGILKGAPWWQTLLMRWGSGFVAGGLTALSSQIITSYNKEASEEPGYSTSYWHAKETYLHSVRLDIRDRLNETIELTDPQLKIKLTKVLLDLDKKIQREIGVAGLKKSMWTAIPGEIKALAHRSRPADSLDPEVPGTLAQSIHSACGKFISLIYFTFMFDQYLKNENKTDSFSSYPALNFVFLNFALILMGYMWKDDLQLVSRVGYAVKKAAKDVTTGRTEYKEKYGKRLEDVTTEIPAAIYGNNDNKSDDDGNDQDNIVLTSTKKTSSEKNLTDREREALDRKRENEGKEQASKAALYANKTPTKMSGSADSDNDDDGLEHEARLDISSEKVEGSSSSSSTSASISSTRTYDDDGASSSEESPTPQDKQSS